MVVPDTLLVLRRLRFFFPVNVSGHSMQAGGLLPLQPLECHLIIFVHRTVAIGDLERYVRKSAALLQAVVLYMIRPCQYLVLYVIMICYSFLFLSFPPFLPYIYNV